MSSSSRRWLSRQLGQGAQLQNEFLRTSWQRAAQFAQRYVEVSQTVMSSTLSTARGQATKA